MIAPSTPGSVGDVEVQVEGALHVLHQRQLRQRRRPVGERRPVITLTTSPSTALAVCRPPAPGPDIVISVIASDSTVTALNGPDTEESGCPAYRNAGCTRTESPSVQSLGGPDQLQPEPQLARVRRSSPRRCSMPS